MLTIAWQQRALGANFCSQVVQVWVCVTVHGSS